LKGPEKVGKFFKIEAKALMNRVIIEIQRANDDHLWLMIHSGSRNLGKPVADFYNREAKEENKRWYSKDDNKDLAFLPLSTETGKQ